MSTAAESGSSSATQLDPTTPPPRKPLSPPPFVRNLIKPSRSDPSLLTSYPDVWSNHMVRMPYHHQLVAGKDGSSSAEKDLSKKEMLFDKAAKSKRFAADSRNDKLRKAPRLSEFRESCRKADDIENIYDHDDVAFKVVDLGNGREVVDGTFVFKVVDLGNGREVRLSSRWGAAGLWRRSPVGLARSFSSL